MELASHGYDGKTVYLKDKHGNNGYWSYEDEEEKVGFPEKRSSENGAYIDQLKLPVNSVDLQKDWHYRFHYDPRRWQGIADSTGLVCGINLFEYLLQSATSDEKLNEFFGIGSMYTALVTDLMTTRIEKYTAVQNINRRKSFRDDFLICTFL